jgi:anti-sigma factor RsiW
MFEWMAMTCVRTRPHLIAWIDGALSPRRARRVGRHVETCVQCAGEARVMRDSIRQQAAALHALMTAGPVEVDELWRRLRGRVVAETAPARVETGWLWRPALAFAVALLVIWGGVTTLSGDPDAVLISAGVKSPPPKLKQQPELFKEYAVIKDLEVLERFDTADIEPLMEAVTPPADQG